MKVYFNLHKVDTKPLPFQNRICIFTRAYDLESPSLPHPPPLIIYKMKIKQLAIGILPPGVSSSLYLVAQ